MTIGFGEQRNRFNAEFFTREDDHKSDFSTICDEYFSEHLFKCLHRSYRGRMAKSFSPYSTGWPFSTSMLTISPARSDSISFMSFMASMMHTTLPFSTKSPTETNASEFGEGAW